MRKIIYLLTPVMVVSLLANCGAENKTSWQLTNPDGSLVIDVALSNKGSLTYSVKKNNQAIVNSSLLGMEFVTNVDGV
ncbi:MAG: glycoside hydrolase family 97 N-terminal domain-containing protein, partial [Bacilli bacterium]|nr:glycoside hydrolase family 97 N-terminal domain-containing protein [Bacilli bacterium]